MLEFCCPHADWEDVVQADSKVEAWREFRCGDCGVQIECDGPILKEVYANRTKTSAKQPSEDRESLCRKELQELSKRPKKGQDFQKMADDFINIFYDEVANARKNNVGWKPISKIAKKHGYTFGRNSLERAFKRKVLSENGEGKRV